mmetsp:Transcript_35023/g.76619  ORF Transcript_35023/g.76619 Transcript_35023/m.76619 type:complete len:97 (+) Transcript_35023:349-639(+)
MSMLSVLSIAFERAATTVFSLFESRAAVGSSRRRICGFRIRAREIATLCLCPPESERPPSPTLVSSSSPKSFFFPPVTGSPATSSASATVFLHSSP